MADNKPWEIKLAPGALDGITDPDDIAAVNEMIGRMAEVMASGGIDALTTSSRSVLEVPSDGNCLVCGSRLQAEDDERRFYECPRLDCEATKLYSFVSADFGAELEGKMTAIRDDAGA